MFMGFPPLLSSHTKWECKYHVVFIPKGRRRALYGQLRQHLGEVFRRLAEQKESRVEGIVRLSSEKKSWKFSPTFPLP